MTFYLNIDHKAVLNLFLISFFFLSSKPYKDLPLYFYIFKHTIKIFYQYIFDFLLIKRKLNFYTVYLFRLSYCLVHTNIKRLVYRKFMLRVNLLFRGSLVTL